MFRIFYMFPSIMTHGDAGMRGASFWPIGLSARAEVTLLTCLVSITTMIYSRAVLAAGGFLASFMVVQVSHYTL